MAMTARFIARTLASESLPSSASLISLYEEGLSLNTSRLHDFSLIEAMTVASARAAPLNW
eukprot:366444-Chlamydomonas_euryale.AAC.34